MPAKMKAELERIAELNRALAETRIDAETYAKIIDLLEDGIILIDKAGMIMLVNQQIEYIFGYGRSSLVGRPLHVLLAPEDAEQHAKYVEHFFRHPSARPMNAGRPFQGRDADGHPLTLLISIAPMVSYDGVLAGAVVRRVTDAT